MMDALIFVAAVSFFVVLLFVYVFFKLPNRSWQGLKDYFLGVESGGSGAIFGIVLAIVLTSFAGLALTAIYTVAKADEFKYLQYTDVYAGIERTFKESPFAYNDGIDNRLTSSLGVDQHIVSYGAVSLTAGYQHHSGAVNRDRYGYDAVGIKVKWRIQ